MPERLPRPRPGTTLGPYPQREQGGRGKLAMTLRRLAAPGIVAMLGRLGRGSRLASQVIERSTALGGVTDDELRGAATAARARIVHHGIDPAAIVECFALGREAAGRALNMRHHACQVQGGLVIFQGGIAEMETGEGKTLTAILPAVAAGLAGVPVHVITANEYLASRDAELMAPVYRLLGLDVAVVDDSVQGNEARRRAYGSDVVYSTNQQVAFDYLRDRCQFGPRRSRLALTLNRAITAGDADEPVLRGLCFAIVDEADSVLIDDAVTPLILTRPGREVLPDDVYTEALAMAGSMVAEVDFQSDPSSRAVRLTEQGRQTIERLSDGRGAPWHQPVRARELVRAALLAVHGYFRDEHYVVEDGAVQLIDQNTGRRMPDRAWEAGLHQLVEAKEGCAVSVPRETVARLSYQSFFRRYHWLGGMTGTADEAAPELWSIYGLSVSPIAPHRRSLRQYWPDQLHPDELSKWSAVVARAGEVRAAGRAALIGTRSVEASEAVSEALTRAGLPHQVLNARQDNLEAQIIAEAGREGAITVATNMAGRGTDISLDDAVSSRGGLHVICAEPNEARRIDRQLFGRCARQGDPGSCERIVSFDDEMLRHSVPQPIKFLSIRTHSPSVQALAVQAAQRRAERRGVRHRLEVSRADVDLSELLSFSGALE